MYFIILFSLQFIKMLSTRIDSFDDFQIQCRTYLPSTMICNLDFQNPKEVGGASLDLRIERSADDETGQNNGKYFDGKMNCHAFTDYTFRSDVKHFSVNVQNGKLSIQVPKFGENSAGAAYMRCLGTDMAIPDNFGRLVDEDGYVINDSETELRIRSEYTRGNMTRQFFDSWSTTQAFVHPPVRSHGTDDRGMPIPYVPLAASASLEYSGTFLDSKGGFNLTLTNVMHDIDSLFIVPVDMYRIQGARFSSLVPHNAYREYEFGYDEDVADYVNCTATVARNGKTVTTFDTVLIFPAEYEDEQYRVPFKTRDPRRRGSWKDVHAPTADAEFSLTCPLLTVLNPTKIPPVFSFVGIVSDYNAYYPSMHLFPSASASGLVSVAVSCMVTIVVVALSLF